MNECSVVLILYYASEQAVMLTLESILRQKKIMTELIISDDGSPENHYHLIEEYLKRNNYNNFKFIYNKKNIGTVKNIYNALQLCQGEFVKVIGAGDLLYNEYTLYEMCRAMRPEDVLGFGLMKEYCVEEGKVHQAIRFSPHNVKAYIEEDFKSIYRNLIKYEQYIPGVVLIYNRQKVMSHFKSIINRVIYCEDMIEALVVLQNEKMRYIDHYVAWYEQGAGLSSQDCSMVAQHIVNDQKSFFEIINKNQKGLWNYLGKKVVHAVHNKRFRSLLKVVFQPGLSFVLLKTRQQRREGVYNKNEKGFLDYDDFFETINK